MKKTLTQEQKMGFTIMEAIVAIGILVIAIGGPLTLASRSLAAAFIAKDQVTGFFLAVEGLEYVRAQRDSNLVENLNTGALGGSDWITLFLASCQGANGCYIEYDSSGVGRSKVSSSACAALGCPVLLLNEAADYDQFQYAVGTESRFTRTITINETIPGSEAVVTSAVAWQTGKHVRSVSVVSTLHNWIEP
jgi:Tfp pilus assembly protein PilV